MTNYTYYELPLNERMRTFLRLEFLFNQCDHFVSQPDAFGSRSAICTILDIFNILSLTDLKKEAIKELERHHSALAPLQSTPGVDADRLGQVLDEISTLTQQLNTSNEHFGQELKSNDFLCNISQRLAIPGGTCEFDMPGYHYWLTLPPEVRLGNISHWLTKLDMIKSATSLILGLTRQSSGPSPQVAENGFFQQNLTKEAPSQLIRVALPSDSPFFAEISGGKHRIAVRFLEYQDLNTRPAQANFDIDFQLFCCRI